jgi:signal transduction histidine kinase
MTFRTRLLLVSLSTLAIGLGALVVIGNVVFGARVRAEASSLLRARADAQLAAVTVQGGHVRVHESPNDAFLDRQSWVLQDGRVIERPRGVSAALDRAAIALGRQVGTRESEGPDDTRLRTQPVATASAGAVVVGLSVAPFETLQAEVLVGSLVVAALVTLAGYLAIRSAVDGALRPVAAMTRSAENWSAHDLDGRFDLGPATDELTGLAATLDSLLARIAASRRHEQRFAGEMAHELRTPVAALRARAELALGEGTGETEALRSVVAQAERLDRTVETLLAIARQELDPTDSTVDLAALAGEIEGVDVTLPPDLPQAEGEPEIVRRALAPLVANARQHARDRVWLELSATRARVRVAVHDDGPGLEPALGDRVFEPGVRGNGAPPGGAGLGLSLARRLARSCGGDVVTGHGPGGCFVLELPRLG